MLIYASVQSCFGCDTNGGKRGVCMGQANLCSLGQILLPCLGPAGRLPGLLNHPTPHCHPACQYPSVIALLLLFWSSSASKQALLGGRLQGTSYDVHHFLFSTWLPCARVPEEDTQNRGYGVSHTCGAKVNSGWSSRHCDNRFAAWQGPDCWALSTSTPNLGSTIQWMAYKW